MRGIQFTEIEFHNNKGNDITNPSTSVRTTHGEEIIYGEVGSPKGEEATKAIDNNYSTKHFNFTNDNDYGLVFEFNEKQIINSFTLTSANDAPSRNPTMYILSGSNDDELYTVISSGNIVDPNYLNEISVNEKLLNSEITRVLYLTGSSLSSSGNITPINYQKINNDVDGILGEMRNMHAGMYFNIKNLNRSIIDNNIYGTLLHYDILSRNNKTQKTHLKLGAFAYANSGDYENSYINYQQAINVNPDDIMSKIEFAAVCLRLEKNEQFRSLVEDIIISKAVIKDQQLANRLIEFIVNSPIQINKKLLSEFVLDLAEFYKIKNIINENGFVKLAAFKENAANLAGNIVNNTSASNYIEINNKKFNVVDFKAGFTIEYWVKKSKHDDFGWLFSYGAEGFGGGMRDGFSILQRDQNTIRFELANSKKGEKTMLDTPMPDNGDWFHMANVWNAFNGEALTYINGKLIGVDRFNGPLIFPESDINVNLGRSIRGWGMSYWGGGLTELRIWKYPRSKRQINKYKNTVIKGNTTGLFDYWKLNQPNGSQIVSHLSSETIGQFPSFKWELTKDLPIYDGAPSYYASFSSVADNGANDNQQNTLNWQRMSQFAKIQSLLGNHENAIKILDMVRFKSPNPTAVNNTDYYDGNNQWDILSSSYAYLLKDDHDTAKKLFENLNENNFPNQLNFNWDGIRFEALKKRVKSELERKR